MVAMSEGEGFKLNKFANKVTGIGRSGSTVVDLMKTVLNFATIFENKYSQKFVATGIMDIVKVMMGSAFLTEMNVQSYLPIQRFT